MKLCLNIALRLLSFIMIIFYIFVLLYINFGNDEDFEYYIEEYKNCIKINETKEEETFSWRDEKEEKEKKEEECQKYNKISFYFFSCIVAYVNIIFDIFQKFSFLINGNKVSSQFYSFALFIFLDPLCALFFVIREKIKRPKTGYTKLIIFIINIFINIILIIILIISSCGQNDQDKSIPDCLDIRAKIKDEEKEKRINNEICTMERKNNLLKEEIQKLLNFKKTKNSNHIDDKKFEAILWYVKKICKEDFSLKILYKYLLEEIKDKFEEVIDNNKLRIIFLGYIKEKFEQCLTCPITGEIFKNPVITPEGQTYDKYNLSKILKDKRENPLTRKKLFKSQLIDNILIKEICVIFTSNEGQLNMENLRKIKKLLINPENNKFYSNPVVIKEGDKKGETKEGMGLISEYSNKAILNLIEQNKNILSDEFFEDLNDDNTNILYKTEENLNIDTCLNINTNSKII